MERKYTGIVLDKYDVGETNRIYTIYTLEMGKIKAVAQGVRKSQAKLAGHLENFNLIDVTVARKNGTGRITGAIIENNFSSLRENIESLECAFKAVDAFNRLVGMEEKDRNAFNLLSGYLESLDSIAASRNEKIPVLSCGFMFKLFELLGYRIEADSCVRCSSALSEKDNHFSCELGGTICKKCSGSVQDRIPAGNNAIKTMRIFAKSRLKSIIKLKVNREDTGNLEIISSRFLEWIAN